LQTLLAAGFPKSGNTLLGGALQRAGQCGSDFDIYSLRSSKKLPMPNKLFPKDTFVIKTHDRWRPADDLKICYFAPVQKLIVVIRNPFDTVLSSVNFLRFQYANGNLKNYMSTFNMFFPDGTIDDGFLEFYSLDNLKSQNLLDTALKNFANCGTNVPSFARMSGPWAGFANSYKYSGLTIMNAKYEELAQLSEQSASILSANGSRTLNELANFLDVDSARLLQGFKSHRKTVLTQHKSGNLFFNKMCAGYWRNYFSHQACKEFVNHYAPEMIDNGYRGLVDEFYS